MDMEEEELSAPEAIHTLAMLTRIEVHVSRFKHDEARELCNMGSKTTGPLTRQPGEPMQPYTKRCFRWYKRSNVAQMHGTNQ